VVALKTAVAEELQRIESTLSHWRPESYTSQFNASETTLETEQPAELVGLVARSLELSRISGGVYDITVAPLVDAWGYGPSGEKAVPPTDEQIAELLGRVGYEKLAADTANNTLRKKHPQLQIDLGSLLQGYAADRIARVLDESGVKKYLIDVGGELFARDSWTVAIEDPRDPATPLRTLVLKDSGMATSGLYRATRQLGPTTAHHLISPQTGRPIAATATLATVVAPTAVEADAWATALLAVGLPDALKLADEQQLSALLVDPEQHTRVNLLWSKLFGPE
jgi:thiamine biosynthesis lipoprotein